MEYTWLQTVGWLGLFGRFPPRHVGVIRTTGELPMSEFRIGSHAATSKMVEVEALSSELRQKYPHVSNRLGVNIGISLGTYSYSSHGALRSYHPHACDLI